ncbi:MAG: PTS transporter subunit IIC [Erysipelotrichaceae bacterium]
MQIILDVFSYIQSLGAIVMMPIIVCLLGIIMKAGFGKSLRAGLTVGVGFIGLNLVTGLMGSTLGTAVQSMVEYFGLSLSVIDVGWPSAAAIAFASQVGTFIIPLCLLVNIIMIVTRTTQTVDVDIWNYWHFAFTGSLVAIITNNVVYGLIAAVINMVIILVIGDATAERLEDTLGMPGVSLPHGFTAAFAPIAYVFNKLIDFIPGVRDIDINLDSMQKKLGVFGEPILVGTLIGIVIGVLSSMGKPVLDIVRASLTLGINLGAVLVLIPKMAALLMEGLLPVSDAATAFIQKRFSGFGKMYIGLDSAVGVGHPMTLTIGLILVPVAILLAVILPGNKVLPFTDLAVLPYITILVIPLCRGNGFRSLLIGLICLAAGLYIATDLAPFITEAAKVAGFDMGSATAISSICDGGNPLTWLLVRLNSLGPVVAIGVGSAIAVAAAVWNRMRITKEAKAMKEAQ